jgi:hypothetical protein
MTEYDRLLSGSVGADGYPHRFGIPDGPFAEPVAVKQGWMCCMDATARATITQAVKTMFPSGRIGA